LALAELFSVSREQRFPLKDEALAYKVLGWPYACIRAES
jgi:hypothetical protein